MGGYSFGAGDGKVVRSESTRWCYYVIGGGGWWFSVFGVGRDTIRCTVLFAGWFSGWGFVLVIIGFLVVLDLVMIIVLRMYEGEAM